MTYWTDKTIEAKYKMTDVFKNQVKELEKIVPLFKIANATIHFDEHSPHMHIMVFQLRKIVKLVYQGKLVKHPYSQKNH